MKRSLLLLTATAVALSPLAAHAAPTSTKRVLTYEYSGFSNVGSPAVSFNASSLLPLCEVNDACWDFATKKGEKTIEIKASDPTQGFQIWFDGAYGGDAGNVQSFCGKGKITVTPKTAHEISVRPALDDCGGVPSEGTLTATILGTK